MNTWTVTSTEHTALGELQQDSGVGGELHNVEHGAPMQTGISFDDNSMNSVDQEGALKTWLKRVDDLMLQGSTPEKVIAELGEQGCPRPQDVFDLWARIKEHEAPNDPTEDLTQLPPTEEQGMTPAPQDLAQQGNQPLASTKTADMANRVMPRGPEPRPVQDAPQQSNLAAMLAEMRDMGWTADADAWEEEANEYHPEDLPMLEQDVAAQLEQMRQHAADQDQGPEAPTASPNGYVVGEGGQRETPGGSEVHMNGEPGYYSKVKEAEYDGHHDEDKSGDHEHLKGKGKTHDKADEIYHAVKRDHPDEDKGDAAAIAWSQAKKTEGDDTEKGKKDKKDDDKKESFVLVQGRRGSYQGIDGTVARVFDDFWADERKVVLATEHGDLTVPAAEVEAPVNEEATDNPVSEIDHFLSIIDPAGHIPTTIQARIENLNQVVAACGKTIREGKVSIADQMALDERSLAARLEIAELQRTADAYVSPEGQAYLEAQPRYEMHAVEQADMGRTDQGGWIDDAYHQMMEEQEAVDYDQMVDEQPALLVSDMSDEVVADPAATEGVAHSFIESKTSGVPAAIRTEIIEAFLAKTELARRNALAKRKATLTKSAAANNYDGPDEALFL